MTAVLSESGVCPSCHGPRAWMTPRFFEEFNPSLMGHIGLSFPWGEARLVFFMDWCRPRVDMAINSAKLPGRWRVFLTLHRDLFSDSSWGPWVHRGSLRVLGLGAASGEGEGRSGHGVNSLRLGLACRYV